MLRIKRIPLHPHIPVLKNDGTGRDTYISFNNGGFGHFKRRPEPYQSDSLNFSNYVFHQDLSSYKPMKRYVTNGTGRDGYVYRGMLEEWDKCKGNLPLPRILRNDDTSIKTNRTRYSQSNTPSKFERRLLNRIFYGKCKGLSDRLMSPKVKFLSKEELMKRIRDSKENNGFFCGDDSKENNLSDNEDKLNKSREENKVKEQKENERYGGVCQTEPNYCEDSPKTRRVNTLFSNSIRLRGDRNRISNLKQENADNGNFVNSVKQIFMFNHKIKTNLDGNTIYSRLRDKMSV